jgi:hypothetical protein
MACEKEQEEVNRLLEAYRDAQNDCNQGLQLRCAAAHGFFLELVAARAALHDCQSAPPPRRWISNLAIVGIERTQATQFFLINGQGSGVAPNNQIPLVANKTLVLRVYVNRTELPGRPIPAYVNGEVTLAGSAPIAAWTPIPARSASSIDRGNFNHTLNFIIPASLCRGAVTFTVTIFDMNNPGDQTYASEPVTFTAHFDAVPLPRIYGVLINYTGLGLNIAAPTPTNLINTFGLVTKTYPISGINFTGFQVATFNGDLRDERGAGCGFGWSQLLSLLSNMRAMSGRTDAYVGLLPTGVPTGRWGGCGGGNVAVTYAGSTSAMAQEVGHVFSRSHAPCGNNIQNVDPSYPIYGVYPSGSIGEFGFDTVTNRVLNPGTTFDFMSYCGPTWVSPYTYLGLKNRIVSLQGASSPLRPGWRDARSEYLRLNFRICAAGRVELLPSFHLDGLTPDGEVGPFTPVWCELLGPEDQVLQTHHCRLSSASHQDPDEPELLFHEFIPWHAETRAIVFRNRGEVCHRHSLEEGPPEITVHVPRHQGHLEGIVSLEWKLAGAAAPLMYFLRYSHDGGATWRVAAADLTEPRCAVNLDLLPGGEDCRFQVAASSGIRTTVSESKPFTVRVKAVQAQILSPMPDAVFCEGEAVVLRGVGFSPNHETTRFDDMLWSSQPGGQLGVGYECVVSTLRTGRHRIALNVPDGFGGEATTGVLIEVRPKN